MREFLETIKHNPKTEKGLDLTVEKNSNESYYNEPNFKQVQLL